MHKIQQCIYPRHSSRLFFPLIGTPCHGTAVRDAVHFDGTFSLQSSSSPLLFLDSILGFDVNEGVYFFSFATTPPSCMLRGGVVIACSLACIHHLLCVCIYYLCKTAIVFICPPIHTFWHHRLSGSLLLVRYPPSKSIASPTGIVFYVSWRRRMSGSLLLICCPPSKYIALSNEKSLWNKPRLRIILGQ